MTKAILMVVATAFALASPASAAYSSCTFSEPIPLDQIGDVILQQYVNEGEGTFTMKITYSGGKAFIGIGVNQEGLPSMTPAVAVIGRNDGDAPQVGKYTLSSLNGVQPADLQEGVFNSTFEQTDTTSTLTFTQRLSEDDQVAITDKTQWIYAIGYDDNGWGGHSIRGSFQLALTPTCSVQPGTGASGAQAIITEIASPNRALWMAHGILMALGWGLFAPLAIGAVVLRVAWDRLGGLHNKGLWFKIHLFLNTLALLCTIIGFVIAMVAKNEQGVNGVDRFQSTHGKMGLSILVLVLVQAIVGLFRPALPKAPTEDKMDDLDTTERMPPADEPSEKPLAKKSSQRLGFEILHRLTGMALLAMAWYNCHTGIKWSTIFLEDYNDWTPAFWSVVSVIGSLILVGKVVLMANPSE
jgi:hypothetical protein